VTTDFEACRLQLFSPTLQESRTAKLLTSEQFLSSWFDRLAAPTLWRSPWRRLTMERFGLARSIKGSSISRKAAFRAHRMGGFIRRLIAVPTHNLSLRGQKAINLRINPPIRCARTRAFLEIDRALMLRAKPNLSIVSLRHGDRHQGGRRQTIKPTERNCSLVRSFAVRDSCSVGGRAGDDSFEIGCHCM